MKNEVNYSDSIFLHKCLKSIADSMIKLFIPLYILVNTATMWLAIIYLVAYSAFVVLVMWAFKKFLQKYAVLSIVIHFVPIIASFAIFSFLPINLFTVLAVSVLMAFGQALYSVPINLIFAVQDKSINVTKFEIASNVGKITFTLIAGFVLSSEIKNSFLFLSIASSVVYILSIVPILSAYQPIKEKYQTRTYEEENKLPNHKWFALYFLSFSCFQTLLDTVLPLYLYQNNLSFEAITIFVALTELLKAGANYLAKIFINHGKQKLAGYICGGVFLLSIVGILFIKNNAIIYILSCVCAISFPLTFVPIFKLFCASINKEGCTIGAMTNRDIEIFSIRPAFYGSYFLLNNFFVCFGLGILSVVVMMLASAKLFDASAAKEPK